MPPTERKNTALQTFVPISTGVENQKKQKIVGQDVSIQQFLPPSLQVVPVPEEDS